MNIHDENFKHNFTQEKVAKDFLLYNLPKEVLSLINLNTLTIEGNELLPSRYRNRRQADILYAVKNKEGKKIYALMHLEGQSKHDKYMAIRVWEYHVAIARAHLRKGNEKIPLILTFVFYHGKEEWTSAKSIAHLFDNFDLYVNVSLKSTFLVNLGEKAMESLKQQGASSAPQILMKAQAHGDYCDILEDLYPLLKANDQLDDKNLDYIITNDRHEPTQLFKKLSKFDLETANHYKTMFEAAIQKAVKREVKITSKKVRIESLEEGKRERDREIALQMLRMGLKTDTISEATKLSVEEIEELKG